MILSSPEGIMTAAEKAQHSRNPHEKRLVRLSRRFSNWSP